MLLAPRPTHHMHTPLWFTMELPTFSHVGLRIVGKHLVKHSKMVLPSLSEASFKAVCIASFFYLTICFLIKIICYVLIQHMKKPRYLYMYINRMFLLAQYSMDAMKSIFLHHFGMKRCRCLQPTSANVWTMAELPTSADIGWSISHEIFSRRLGYQLHKQSLSIICIICIIAMGMRIVGVIDNQGTT